MQELVNRVPVALLDPEQLRRLTDGDEDGETEDKPLDDGNREELRDEAEPEKPGEQEHDPGDQDQSRTEGRVLRSMAGLTVETEEATQHRRGRRTLRRPGAGSSRRSRTRQA